MSVAEAVRKARRDSGFTQKSLAEALGIEPITISRWERGATTPSLARLRKVAELTETPITEFVQDGSGLSALVVLQQDVAKLRRDLEALARRLEANA